jgi:hypothetical protein
MEKVDLTALKSEARNLTRLFDRLKEKKVSLRHLAKHIKKKSDHQIRLSPTQIGDLRNSVLPTINKGSVKTINALEILLKINNLRATLYRDFEELALILDWILRKDEQRAASPKNNSTSFYQSWIKGLELFIESSVTRLANQSNLGYFTCYFHATSEHEIERYPLLIQQGSDDYWVEVFLGNQKTHKKYEGIVCQVGSHALILYMVDNKEDPQDIFIACLSANTFQRGGVYTRGTFITIDERLQPLAGRIVLVKEKNELDLEEFQEMEATAVGYRNKDVPRPISSYFQERMQAQLPCFPFLHPYLGHLLLEKARLIKLLGDFTAFGNRFDEIRELNKFDSSNWPSGSITGLWITAYHQDITESYDVSRRNQHVIELYYLHQWQDSLKVQFQQYREKNELIILGVGQGVIVGDRISISFKHKNEYSNVVGSLILKKEKLYVGYTALQGQYIEIINDTFRPPINGSVQLQPVRHKFFGQEQYDMLAENATPCFESYEMIRDMYNENKDRITTKRP